MKEPLKLNKLFHIEENVADFAQNKTFVGIDFGTSTTVVSIAAYNPATKNIDCRSLQLPQKDKRGAEMFGELFPTIIAINPENDKPIYGQGAYDLKWDPDYTFGVNIWHSFKMELGKDLGPRWYESRQSRIKSPQDATRQFFKFLKKSIEKTIKDENLPANIQYAVSIPASFESNQRIDLMNALKENGIIVDGSLFIDEPNAAFLGYINSQDKIRLQLNENYNPKVVVFDFGAGTCDISLLEITVDHHGIHSNNISISQFSELGGNDIDRYIAHNYLLPQLLEANRIDGKEKYLTSNQKEFVASQLMGIAENMKKRLCSEDFNYLLSDPETMDVMVASGHGISVDTPELSIDTNIGTLTIPKLWLSYKDFITAMNVFFTQVIIPFWDAYTVKEQQKKYNNINYALQTALEKGHVNKSEVDYVLMIGGSSKNPFVQHQIKKYFNNAEVIVPRDIQSLVSQGTALHSILINGLHIEVVRPIVGESIVIITQSGELPIIPAGTPVPFSYELKNCLSTKDKEYSEIEIPICVGSDKKLIHNLILTRSNGQSFPKETEISLSLELDSNKIFKVEAHTLGETWKARCSNPLDNSALTDGELKILIAQRNAYVSAANNGNRPTANAFDELSKAYEDNKQEFLAAETLEEKLMYYPDNSIYNKIGVLFHNSGNENRAIIYFKKALRQNPNNATVNNNLGHDLFIIGEYEQARKYIEKAVKLKGDYAIALTVLARLDDIEGKKDDAMKAYQRAFNIFKRKWSEGNMDNVEKGWFRSVAEKMGEKELCEKLKDEMRKDTTSKGYTLDNTLFGNNSL